MAEGRLYKTDAIILKHSDIGEADRLLTMYTPQRGKIRAVAKGARRPGSKLAGHLEPFTLSRLMVAKGRQFDYVAQAQTLRSFQEIRDNLTLLGHACYLAELVDRFSEEQIGNQALYDLLLSALENLAQARDLGLLLRYFELHLLELVGYRPELYRCLSCKSELQPITNAFSPAAGGVLCPRCAAGEASRWEISVDALKCLRYLQANDYPQASRLRLTPVLRRELATILGETLRYTLERDLKSAAFLTF